MEKKGGKFKNLHRPRVMRKHPLCLIAPGVAGLGADGGGVQNAANKIRRGLQCDSRRKIGR